MSDFYNSLKSMGSIGDYQKLEEEFQLKKAQAAQQQQINDIAMQKAQAEIAQPDIEGLASRSLFEYHQGKPLSPEGKAALETLAVLKGSSVKYQPDEFGNVRAVTEPNPFQQFLGNNSAPSFGGSMPSPRTLGPQGQGSSTAINLPYDQIKPMDLAGIEAMTQDAGSADIEFNPNSPGMTLGQKQPSDLSKMAFKPENAPSLDPEVAGSAFGRKAIFEKQLKLMEDMNNPATEIGKMQLDEKRGLVPQGTTQALIKEKSRQTRKEDLALQNEEKAAKEADEQAKATKDVAQKKVKEALGVLGKSFTATGVPATLAMSLIPGKAMPADVLNSAYSTLKSNISLDAMTKLKQASSTGSTGFGALSQNELKILTDKIGELDAELPYATQMQNLKTIAQILKLDVPELTGGASTNDVQDLIDRYAD